MKSCERCQIEKEDVEYVIEPFGREIYGVEEWQWLCDECLMRSFSYIFYETITTVTPFS